MLKELKKVIDNKNLEYVENEESIEINIYEMDFNGKIVAEKIVDEVINNNKTVKTEKDSTGVLHIQIKD